MAHREYTLTAGNDGFSLAVTGYNPVRWHVSNGIEHVLGLLGHPCCGRGLGRSEPVNAVAWRVLTTALRWQDRGRAQVVRIPLTNDVALALAPEWAQEWLEDGANEE